MQLTSVLQEVYVMSNNIGAAGTAGSPRRLDLPLLALMVILAGFNLPYWDSRFMVGHDTKNSYLLFHYFYNHLVWYGELPQWLPFGEYGYSSLFFQICNNSPCSYLAGLLGWVLHIKDSLLLFKLAAFGDQLVFLFGLHLLSRLLYRHRVTSFIICLSGIGCVVWTAQLYWGLRFFYLLPLALYCFFRFFTERLPWAFWCGLLTLLFVFVGGLPYWAPIYFYLFLVMALVMLPAQWRAFGALIRPQRQAVLPVLATIGCAVAMGYIMANCLSGLHSYAPGRAENGMYTDLKTFLTYITPDWQLLSAFIDSALPNPENLNLYVGLLPLGTLPIALRHVRDRRFSCLFGGLLAILLLAGSGMSSWVLYWLVPGMKTFRHLGLLLELAKILVLLSAGFGLDLLVSRLKIRGWLEKHFSTFTFLSLLVGLCLILDMLVSVMAYNPDSWASPMQFTTMLPLGGGWSVVRLSAWGISLTLVFVCLRLKSVKSMLSPRVLLGLLVVVCLLDMGSYQCYQWQIRSQGQYAGRIELEPLRYADSRDSRTWALSPGMQQKMAVIASAPGGTHLAYIANLMQLDPCIPMGRIDLFPLGVHKLLTARGANPVQGTIKTSFLPPDDPKLLTVMGCDAPKLRFVAQAQFAGTDRELTSMISSATAPDTNVILRGASDRPPAAATPPDPTAMSYRPTFFNANRLDLDVTVKPGLSGWLVFADAFDPHWQASINGTERPVLEAYLAFKALAITGGDAKVSFRYENSRQKHAMSLLIITGIILAGGCLFGLGWQLCHNRRDTDVSSLDKTDAG